MKIILPLLFLLFTVNAKSQLNVEDFIGKDCNKMVIHYADNISSATAGKFISSKLNLDSNPTFIIFEILSNYATSFLCKSDTIYSKFSFFYEMIENVEICTKIILSTNSCDCTTSYFMNFLLRTHKLNWKKNKATGSYTTQIIRKEKQEKNVVVILWESSFENGTFIIEEKRLTKNEWKEFVKN